MARREHEFHWAEAACLSVATVQQAVSGGSMETAAGIRDLVLHGLRLVGRRVVLCQRERGREVQQAGGDPCARQDQISIPRTCEDQSGERQEHGRRQ